MVTTWRPVWVNGQADPPCAETLLERAWDENVILFTNSVRVTISALRKKLGRPDAMRGGNG